MAHSSYRGSELSRVVGGVLVFGAIATIPTVPAIAQIVPDATLGGESSRVTREVEIRGELGDRIDAGAIRGSALFHSFSEFNVNELQRVYFDNPAGVEAIFSRVTGTDVSDIFGTLGVDGTADLFFLNPNGIVFGPNARLDIAGSFVATTADRFEFADGRTFSAVNPDAPPLLTMNVTPGLQYGRDVGARHAVPQQSGAGTITNQGILTVGQDLTLDGANLNLQGQLWAGRDLILHAQDTVMIHDSVVTPFIASSGQHLVVQGNQAVDLFALNHPESGLFAGGNLTLRSASPVIGDAHYWSGGSFRIEQLDESLGDLLSPNDPVIRAAGDVAFDSYEGASLHIFAGGSVTVPGAIVITEPDPVNGIVETVTLSNGSAVNINGQTTPTLDIRAGTLAVNPVGAIGDTTGFVLGAPATEPGATSANITIGSIRNEGGTVFLTNQYQPNLALVDGDIRVGAIDTSVVRFTFPPAVVTSLQARGGGVVIDAREQLQLTGVVNTSGWASIALVENAPVDVTMNVTGGPLQLIAGESITTDNLVTSARSNQLIVAPTNGSIGDVSQESLSGSVVIRSARSFVETGDIITLVLAVSDVTAQNLNEAPIGALNVIARSGDVTVEGATSTTIPLINTSASATINAESITTGFNDASSQMGNVFVTTDVGDLTLTSGALMQVADSITTSALTDIMLTSSRMGDISALTRLGAIALNSNEAIQITNLNVAADTNLTAIAEANLSVDPAASVDAGFIGQINIDTARQATTLNSGAGINLQQLNGGVNITTDLEVAAVGGEGGTVTGGAVSGLNVVAQGDAIALTTDGAINVDIIDTSTTVITDVNVRSFGNFVEAGVIDDITVTALSSPMRLDSQGTLEANTLNATAAIGVNTNVTLNGSFIEGGTLGTLSTTTAGGSIALNSGADLIAQNLQSNAMATVQATATARSRSRGDSRSTGGTIDTVSITTAGGAITLDSRGTLTTGSIDAIADTTAGLTTNASADAGPDTGAGANATAIGGTINNASMMSQGGIVTVNSATSTQTGAVTVQANTRLDVDSRVTVEAYGIAFTDPLLPVPILSIGDAQATGARVGALTVNAQGGTFAVTSTNQIQTADINTSAQSFTDVNLSVRASNTIDNTQGVVIADGGTTGFDMSATSTGGAIDLNSTESITTDSLDSSARSSANIDASANGADGTVGDQILRATGGAIDLAGLSDGVTLNEGSAITANVIGGDGDGGDIQISGASVQLTDSLLTTTVTGEGNAGDITIDVTGDAIISGSRLLTGRDSGADGTGASGRIDIRAGSIELTNLSFLNTATFGTGDAGDVFLETTQGDISLNNSSIFSLTAGQGNSGSISINSAGALRLEGNSLISTAVALGVPSTTNSVPGNITVNAANGVEIIGIGVVDQPTQLGTNPNLSSIGADNIATAQSINDSFSLVNAPQDAPDVLFPNEVPYVAISASNNFVCTFGCDRSDQAVSNTDFYSFEVTAVGTQITFDVDDTETDLATGILDVDLNLYDSNGNQITSNSSAPISLGADGSTTTDDAFLTYIFNEPGTYFIEARSSHSSSTPNFYDVQGDYTLNVSRVDDFLVSSGITTQTRSGLPSGNITVNAPTITIQNGGQISAETLREGPAGNIALQPLGNGQDLTINIEGEGSQISASTLNSGAGGTLTLSAPERINLQGDGTLRVETASSGAAGNIDISTPTLNIQGPLDISTTATETATASGELGGNFNLNVSTLNLSAPARLTAETNGAASAGSMTIRPYRADETLTLNFQNSNAALSTSTSGTGSGGNMLLIAPGSVLLRGNGQVLAETSAAGNAGAIRIETPRLAIRNGVEVSTTTEGEGRGGNIVVTGFDGSTAERVAIANAELSAETSGTAQAGSIDITTQELSLENNAEITTSTDNEGASGNITLQVSDRLTLRTSTIRSESNPVDDEVDDESDDIFTENPGNAGDIEITTADLRLFDDALISASNVSSGGGNIEIRGLDQLVARGGSEILASTDTGIAGTINVDATGGRILLRGAGTRLSAETETTSRSDQSEAGDVTLNASQLNVENGAEVSISTRDGRGGNLTLTVDDLLVSESIIRAQTDNGVAGNLTVNTPQNPADSVVLSGVLADGTPSGLSVEATGTGNAGILRIYTRDLTVQNGADLSAETIQGNVDNTGDTIRITGLENLTIDNARISASTQRQGFAGGVRIEASESVRLSGSWVDQDGNPVRDDDGNELVDAAGQPLPAGIFVEGQGEGIARPLRIRTGRLIIENGAQASVSTEDGRGGDLIIRATDVVRLRNGGGLFARATGRGVAGSIDIETQRLSLQQNSIISATNVSTRNVSTRDSATRGIRLSGLETLQVIDSVISTSTESGRAGNVQVNQGDRPVNTVMVSGADSRIAAEATDVGGNAGRVQINVQDLTVRDGGEITATNRSGESRGVRITNLDTLNVISGGSITASTRTGQAGDVQVNTGNRPVNTIMVSGDNSRIAAEARGEDGNAGRVQLNVQELTVQNGGAITASNRTGSSEGVILTSLNALDVLGGGSITASTRTGEAGDVQVNNGNRPVNTIRVSGAGSEIAAEATTGIAGDVQLQVRDLTVSSGGAVTTSTRTGTAGNVLINANEGDRPANTISVGGEGSRIASESTAGEANSIQINVRNLNILRGGEITASTDTGTAGNLTISNANRVQVNGSESRLAVEANGENGVAGNLTLSSNRLDVEAGGRISVSSEAGVAGNLAIAAPEVFLNNGQLTAVTGQPSETEGANLILRNVEFLFMENDSLLSASALNRAAGGNITINTIETASGFIIAPGFNNSDIIATANQGQGGEINIFATQLFGFTLQDDPSGLRDNRTNDISASSSGGPQGVVNLNTLNVDPSRGLGEIPIALVEAPPLDAICGAQRNTQGRSEFIVSGREGLPANPSDSLSATGIPAPWVTRQESGNVSPPTQSSSIPESHAEVSEIVEAQGFLVAADGTVSLVSEAVLADPSPSGQGNSRACR